MSNEGKVFANDSRVKANAAEGWRSGRDPTEIELTCRGLEEWKRPGKGSHPRTPLQVEWE